MVLRVVVLLAVVWEGVVAAAVGLWFWWVWCSGLRFEGCSFWAFVLGRRAVVLRAVVMATGFGWAVVCMLCFGGLWFGGLQFWKLRV